MIVDEQGSYYCFCCQETGDALSFVQGMAHVTAADVARCALAEPHSVGRHDLRGRMSSGPPQKRLFAVNQEAALYFTRNLYTTAATECSELLRARGVPGRLVKLFKLGYAPSSYGGLLRELRSAGFTAEEAVAAGSD